MTFNMRAQSMQTPNMAFPAAPDYWPFRQASWRLAMGLAPLALRDWIEPDTRMAVELRTKERLLQERHAEVFIALPEAAAACTEVLTLLAVHLPERFPTLYQRQGTRLHNLVTGQGWDLAQTTLHPLDLAGRLVQEDLCMMQYDPTLDAYRLVAASVCFPTRWRLAEKIGRPVGGIHAPVPGYEEHLAATMDHFFARLKPDRPVWRINWSLLDNPGLFQPYGHGQQQHNPVITSANAGVRLWIRMERQTLRRLPASGDIVFTIRVYVQPLQALAAQPERAAALAVAIRTLPVAMQRYKSLPPFVDAVLAWLDRVGEGVL